MITRAHNFRTITDADWAAMFRARRALGHIDGNSMLARIRARVAERLPELRQDSVTTERAKLGVPQNAICAPAGAAPCVGVVAQRKLGMSARPFPRQSTAQSEHRPLITPVRRTDAFPFTAAGSADRKGGGTPRAEAGGGEFVLGKQSDSRERPAPFQP